MIPDVDIPVGEKGIYKIERKEVKQMIRVIKNGRWVPEGTYTFLYRDGTLIMSDTPDEKRDHYEPVIKAKGNCLIAGLGIGMVLNAIAMKRNVNHIDVVEVSQEVIDLVGFHYKEKFPGKITFHCDSIYEWTPPKGHYWDIAWFDIWDNLCLDNLEDMTKLHKKYARKAKWKGSWGKDFLQSKREEFRKNLDRYNLK